MLLFAGTLMLMYAGAAWRRHDVAIAMAFASLCLMLVAFALAA